MRRIARPFGPAIRFIHLGAPRPTRLACDHDCGRSPGSRVDAWDRAFPAPKGASGVQMVLQLSAYSCGGSRGIAWTGHAHRIPY